MGQEFRRGLAGQFWLGFSCEVAVGCWLGLKSSEGLIRTGEYTFKVADTDGETVHLGLRLEPMWLGLEPSQNPWSFN